MWKGLLFLCIVGIFCNNNVWAQKKKKDNKTKTPTVEMPIQQQLQISAKFIEAVKERLNGNFSSAENLLREVMAADPTHDASYYEYAQILLENGNYSGAIAELKRAISLNENNIWYQVLLAEIYDKTGQYSLSEKLWEYIAQESPQNIEYLYKYTLSLIYQNKLKEAIAAYNKIEIQMGVNEDITTAKRNIWLHLNKIDNAAKEMEKLAETHPLEAKYYIEIADMYISNKMPEKATIYLQKAAKVDPNNPKVNVSLYNYFTENKQYNEAFKYLLPVFASTELPIDDKIKILLAYHATSPQDTTRTNKAYQLLDNLLKAHPDNPIAWSMYADFCVRDHKYKAAREAYEKVLELDNSKYQVWEQYLMILLDIKDWDAAYFQGAEAISLFPNRSVPYLCHGMAAYIKKDFSQAVESLEEGKNYAVTDAEMFRFNFYLAESYAQIGKYQQSDRYYETLLAKYPQNSVVLNNYSFSLSKRGERILDALSMAKKATDISPNQAIYEDTYGWAFFQNEDYTNAKIWLEKALSHQGDKNIDILLHYSQLLDKMGDISGAKIYKSKAEALKKNE
ncbi:MAG: tetratricopeptide repeat protein [Bacteroidales bacterium]|nr:tetratricopeptide repeat protein [Bacteroidales bacterium]